MKRVIESLPIGVTMASCAGRVQERFTDSRTSYNVLFDELRAEARGEGAISNAVGSIALTLQGSGHGRMKIDVRGNTVFIVESKGRCQLFILDKNTLHKQEFRSDGKEVFLSWVRDVQAGETIQLSFWVTSRTSPDGGSGAILSVDSVDITTDPGLFKTIR